MTELKYDAFISYRHLPLDKAVAKRLHTLIETYRIPKAVQASSGKKKMGKVFRDEEELPLSVNLSDNIEEALEASEWLIVICTPALLQSKWCMKEIDHFISLGRRDHILAVLADGTPETSFPPQLLTVEENGQMISVEPLAANIVSSSHAGALKKLNSEKMRILAPMLSVNYDDLKRRARERKIKTILATSAVALAVCAVSGIYIHSNNKRNEALKSEAEEERLKAAEQETIAKEQEKIAKEQEKLAEENRKKAAYNNIGELLKKAENHISRVEKTAAVSALNDAIAISDDYDGMRKEEILPLLRTALYAAPYTPITVFYDKDLRLLNMVPSPDGIHSISIENNNSVAVTDLLKNEVVYTVSKSNEAIMEPRYSADGARFLAITDMGRSVTVWNAADGSECYSYTCNKNEKYNVANAFFLTDDTILIQDMDEFYKVDLSGQKELIYTIGEAMDGFDASDNLFLYALGIDPRENITLSNEDYTGTPVCVSKDGKKILVAGLKGDTGSIVIDTDGKKICLLEGMPGCFTEEYFFSPDGSTVSCISYYSFFAAWDTETGKLLYFYTIDREKGNNKSNIAFSPVNDNMAFVMNNYLFQINAKTAELVFSGTIDDTSITPQVGYTADGKALLLRNQNLLVIDADKGFIYQNYAADFSAAYNNCAVIGDRIYVSKNDGSAWIFSTESNSTVYETGEFADALYEEGYKGKQPETGLHVNSEHEISDAFKMSAAFADFNADMFFSGDARYVALAHKDGVIEVFTADGDGKPADMIGQLTMNITALVMSDDLLVACDSNGRVLEYDLKEKTVSAIYSSGKVYNALALNTDNTMVAGICGNDNTIDVLKIGSESPLFTMVPSSVAYEVAFSADGRNVVGITTGDYIVGDLLMDEEKLINRAKEFDKK